MTKRIAATSPQLEARAAGALWLTCIVMSVLAFAAGSSLVVRDDAAATAANILANESLFRLGFTADLISGASYVGVTALLYYVLKPAGRSLSLLAASFGLCGVAVGGVAFLCHSAPLVLLHGEQYLGAFTTSQLQVMSLFALKLRAQFFSVGMVFFGIQCIIVGCLIVRSTFLPRALGVLLALGGSGYLFFSFANFLAPPFGARLTPFIMPIALVGEGALTAWLIMKGVNVRRWTEQAVAATEPAARDHDARPARRQTFLGNESN
ncbi:MAG: DUF4386 domain-containing protein [Acidobacteriota bacterium]|nr:DUF4386 domain-containing protein [Acidobacteriota bacterium]